MVTSTELGLREATIYENQRYADHTPRIITARQRALSGADILQQQLAELKVFAQKQEGKPWTRESFERDCPWNTHCFYTGDGMVGVPGMVALLYDSEMLRTATPQTPLVSGGVPFTGEITGRIRIYSGEQLKELDRKKLLNQSLREAQVVDGDYVHPSWNGIARGDNDLIRELVPLKFKALKDCYDYNEGMGLFVPDDGHVRALVLNWTDDRADAYGVYSLDLNYARIVGVRRLVAEKGAEGTAPLVGEVVSPKIGDLEGVMRDLLDQYGHEAVEGALRAYENVRKRLEDNGKIN